MLDSLKALYRSFSASGREKEAQERLAEARRRTPVPVLWLFGKTQSGKSSIVKFLTGATEAEIGTGFRPCTRFSRTYDFPTAEAPILSFLDTRGLDEPGYEPDEDIAKFDDTAHLVLVTVKVTDHALENLARNLVEIRQAKPSRPVILALTCLHEAYPRRQHPVDYPFKDGLYPTTEPEELRRTISEHATRFKELVDVIVPIDLTKPEEGFDQPNYGGDVLKQTILDRLPSAYRQTLLTLDQITGELGDAAIQRAMPTIMGYSTLAGTVGAIPIPFIDLFILPGIQIKMVTELAKLYGQPLTGQRFVEVATTLGLGMIARQAAREVTKLIPFVGAAAGAALAGASTYALGRAFCFYYQHVHEGHVPDPALLKQYFEKELADAQRFWACKPTEPGTKS
ncbi:MAG: DUF697 domain-containing protein [Planctomycetes bacterium]|nr:DUF697 domain-containing protein [Planctomycetota bacterium]